MTCVNLASTLAVPRALLTVGQLTVIVCRASWGALAISAEAQAALLLTKRQAHRLESRLEPYKPVSTAASTSHCAACSFPDPALPPERAL